MDLMKDYSIRNLLDPVTNFGKVTVSSGYNDTATVIILNTGDGTRLPDITIEGYNLTWWNVTDYPDVADDPNREIVRAISKVGDTIVVMRGQENILASTKNIPGKTYKMILSITAKMIPDIQTDAQNRVDTHRTNDVHSLPQPPQTHDNTAHYQVYSTQAQIDSTVETHRLMAIHSLSQPPQLHGGEVHRGNVVTITGNYTASLSDDTILCNASTTSFTVSLPNAGSRTGKIYNIKKIDNSTNGIIIDPYGTQTIESFATVLIQNQWDYYVVQSTGSDWVVLSSPTVVSMGQLSESITNYNSPPYSGLIDTITRSESQVTENVPPKSGLIDNLKRSESVSITN